MSDHVDSSLHSSLNDPSEIRRLVLGRTEMERGRYERPEPDQEPSPLTSEQILKALGANEDGDAGLYIDLHQNRFCFDNASGQWYRWAGHFWKEDHLNEATAAIDAVIELYTHEAQKQAWERLKAEKAGKSELAKKHAESEEALFKRIRTLQTKARKENVLFLARTGAASLGITGQEWDVDPWLLGCLNGVIDLRTGDMRPGDPSDFIKTVAPVEWEGLSKPALTWERFLDEIFGKDQELICYAQRLFGYCISGRTTEHIYLILHGNGRNGKGTLLEILAHVLGDYAGQVEAELILKQREAKRSGGPTSDIMALRGKRLVWSSETDEGRRLNAGRVKWLCGGDTLTGREVFGKRQVSFRPTHKLFLLTNHKPHADARDFALWQRIHLIPFNQVFVSDPHGPNEHRVSLDLLDDLKDEAPGILSWLVTGCLAWQSEGLNPPRCVKTATKEYQESEDLVKQFLSERCEIGTGFEIQAGTLYAAFKVWCDESGIRAISGVIFGKQIKERFDWREDRRRIIYIGLELLHDK